MKKLDHLKHLVEQGRWLASCGFKPGDEVYTLRLNLKDYLHYFESALQMNGLSIYPLDLKKLPREFHFHRMHLVLHPDFFSYLDIDETSLMLLKLHLSNCLKINIGEK